jgi:hypothetical protein
MDHKRTAERNFFLLPWFQDREISGVNGYRSSNPELQNLVYKIVPDTDACETTDKLLCGIAENIFAGNKKKTLFLT